MDNLAVLLIVSIIVGGLAGVLGYAMGAAHQGKVDACQVAQLTNYLGLNNAKVIEYCA